MNAVTNFSLQDLAGEKRFQETSVLLYALHQMPLLLRSRSLLLKHVLLRRLLFFALLVILPTGRYAAARPFELRPQKFTVTGGNSAAAHAAAFSPDGRTIAAVAGGNITLWNTHGYLIKEVELSSSPITAIAFSAKGEGLIAAHQDGAVREYALWTGKILRIFSGPGTPSFTCLAANRGGSVLAAGASDGTLRSWDSASARILWKVQAHGGPVSSVSISDSGNVIVSGSKETTSSVKLWDGKGRGLGSRAGRHFCATAAISPDGKAIAVAYADRSLELLGPDLRQNGRASLGTPSVPACVPLKFSPDGRLLAAVSPMAERAWIFGLPAAERKWGEPDALLLPLKAEADLGEGPWGWNLSASIVASFSHDSRYLSLNLLKQDRKSPEVLTIGPTVILIDARTGSIIKSMRNMSEYSRAVDISPDGSRLLSGSPSGPTKLWNLDGRLIGRLGVADTSADTVAFSRDGSRILVTAETGQALLLNGEGKVLRSYVAKAWHARAALSWDNRLIARFVSKSAAEKPGDAYVRVEDVESGKLLTEFPVKPPVRTVLFDPDEKYIIWPDGIWDIAAGALKADFGRNHFVSISPGSAILATCGPAGVQIRDMTGKVLSSFNAAGTSPRCMVRLDESGGLVAVTGDDGTIEIRDPATFSLKRTLKGHKKTVTSLAFSRDGRFLASAGEDDSIRLWNTGNGESFILYTNKDEWLMHTPDGYFDASPHGGEMAAMVSGPDAFGIEQFAAANNRPDLILERMGIGSPEAISYYQALYQDRLKKLGLSEAAAVEPHVPAAEILSQKQDGKFLSLRIRLSDDRYPLNRYNIYANNVPLLGPYGREVRGKEIYLDEKVELTRGRNKIEVSAVNKNGAESFRALAYADYAGVEKGELYYLAFGASKYKDKALELNYADKDVRDMLGVVRKMGAAYSAIHTKTFLNSAATSAAVRSAKNFLEKAGTDDTVILHIAGHGGYNRGKDNKYYFFGHDTDPGDLSSTGVDFESLENLLNGIKPRRKLFLMDTCDSGELDDTALASYYEKANAGGFIPRAYRRQGQEKPTRQAPSRQPHNARERFIHNNLHRRSGAVIFSSSKSGEISYESSAIKNGFFTRELITALTSKIADNNRDGKLDTDELRNYVSEAVARDTGDLQHPVIDRDNLYQEIELPILSGN